MTNRLVCILALLCMTWHAGAAETWKNYTSMKEVRGVVCSGDTVWAATSGGLFVWARATNTYHTFTAVEGLRSIDLTAIEIDRVGDVWVGTATGILQILSHRDGSWRYVLDIALSGETRKRINSISFSGDSLLICTAFGVCVYDRGTCAFRDTYRNFGTLPPNMSATSAAIFNDSIWVAVSDGQNNNMVAVAARSERNLISPDPWSVHTIGSSARIPTVLSVFCGRLYAGTSSGMYVYASGTWTSLPALAGKDIVAAGASESFLNICTTNEVYTIDRQGLVQQVGPSLPFAGTSVTNGTYGNLLVGVTGSGCLTLDSAWTQHCPDGPNSSRFPSVTVDADGNVWGASAYVNGSGFYRYDGRSWKSFTTANSALPVNEVYRVSAGVDGSVWASTVGRGIVEMPRGSTDVDSARIFGSNVGMVGVELDPSFIVPTAVVCDTGGQTWMSVLSPANGRVFVVRKRDGSWMTFPVTSNGIPVSNLADPSVDRCLAVDRHNNIWATVAYGFPGAVLCLGNGGGIDSTAEFLLTTADGLPSNEMTTVVVDHENHVWVGTNQGIAIILDPDNPRRRGGIASYTPLIGQLINTIAVDSLDQKWVGTPDGVIVLSPDGSEPRAQYSVLNTNGMLIDNDVKSIAIDERTGTVYMGTLSGLSSLTIRETPKPELPVQFSLSQNYPNPFNAATTILYELPGASHVKLSIYDILGREVAVPVNETQSPGQHQAKFDGRNLASGVYFYRLQAGNFVQTRKLLLLR